MSGAIQTGNEGDVLVARLEGRLDSSNAKEVEEALMAEIEGREAVVIDFGGLEYISSAGLRVILLAGKRMRASRGQLALCDLAPPIREVFEISGFLSIFSVYAGRDEAIDAVRQPAG